MTRQAFIGKESKAISSPLRKLEISTSAALKIIANGGREKEAAAWRAIFETGIPSAYYEDVTKTAAQTWGDLFGNTYHKEGPITMRTFLRIPQKYYPLDPETAVPERWTARRLRQLQAAGVGGELARILSAYGLSELKRVGYQEEDLKIRAVLRGIPEAQRKSGNSWDDVSRAIDQQCRQFLERCVERVRQSPPHMETTGSEDVVRFDTDYEPVYVAAALWEEWKRTWLRYTCAAFEAALFGSQGFIQHWCKPGQHGYFGIRRPQEACPAHRAALYARRHRAARRKWERGHRSKMALRGRIAQ